MMLTDEGNMQILNIFLVMASTCQLPATHTLTFWRASNISALRLTDISMSLETEMDLFAQGYVMPAGQSLAAICLHLHTKPR